MRDAIIASVTMMHTFLYVLIHYVFLLNFIKILHRNKVQHAFERIYVTNMKQKLVTI